MMKKLSFSNLLLFSTLLSQGIAVASAENIGESSDLHIRRKRVIDLTNEEGRSIFLEGAPYVVNIQDSNNTICAGSILSAVFVLAPEPCAIPSLFGSLRRYTILSGSELRNHGTRHNIEKRIHVVPNPTLVLLQASPHFDFQRSPNRPISLFLGVVPHIAYGIFTGWGCTKPGNLTHEAVYPEKLMQTRLYIIPLMECIRIYHRRIPITNDNICTLDRSRRRGTCIDDLGGPLVVQFPPLTAPCLLGIMSGVRAEKFGKDPDVFISLNQPDINQWITHVINDHGVH